MKRTISLLLFGSLWLVAPLESVAGEISPNRSLAAYLALVATQQPSDDPRWSAWIGCWTPGARPGQPSETTVCVVPDGSGVRMVTFAGEREALSEQLVADGSTQALREQACRGERVTRWSASGPRLFSTATLTCANQPVVKTTGLSTLLSADQWLDVQVANIDGREQVRTRRFWRSTAPAPAAVAEALGRATRTRPAIGATTIDDVLEANRYMASVGVEAWIAESRAQVPLDRRALVQLADAKVAPHVIDVMVALAFPEKFEVRRQSSSGGGSWSSGWLDDFTPGDWGYLADVYGYGFGSFGVPYFMGSNAYIYPGGFSYAPVGGGGGSAEETSHGQVVNGQGYTRIQPREAVRTAPLYRDGGGQTASDAGSSGGSVGSSGGGSDSSAATPSGYSGGGGSATGLTAVPR